MQGPFTKPPYSCHQALPGPSFLLYSSPDLAPPRTGAASHLGGAASSKQQQVERGLGASHFLKTCSGKRARETGLFCLFLLPLTGQAQAAASCPVLWTKQTWSFLLTGTCRSPAPHLLPPCLCHRAEAMHVSHPASQHRDGPDSTAAWLSFKES